MENINSFLIKYQQPVIKKKRTSERNGLIEQIYTAYTSQQQRNFRKKANWKRYIDWLKDLHTRDTKELQAKFKKSKMFIREHEIKSFCFFLSHIPTADLYYLISIAKDCENRNTNFGSYLMYSIKRKVDK